MNRDEILAKSRAENAAEDERGRLIKLESASVSRCAFFILFCLLKIFVPLDDMGDAALNLLFFGGVFSQFTYQAIKQKSVGDGICSVISACFTPLFDLLPVLCPGSALTSGPHPTQTPAGWPVFAFPISMDAPKAHPSKAQALPNQDHMVIRPHGHFVQDGGDIADAVGRITAGTAPVLTQAQARSYFRLFMGAATPTTAPSGIRERSRAAASPGWPRNGRQSRSSPGFAPQPPPCWRKTFSESLHVVGGTPHADLPSP